MLDTGYSILDTWCGLREWVPLFKARKAALGDDARRQLRKGKLIKNWAKMSGFWWFWAFFKVFCGFLTLFERFPKRGSQGGFNHGLTQIFTDYISRKHTRKGLCCKCDLGARPLSHLPGNFVAHTWGIYRMKKTLIYGEAPEFPKRDPQGEFKHGFPLILK